MPIWSFGTSRYGVPDNLTPEPGQEPLVMAESVTPSYFETMGITLKQGRKFSADDNETHPNVVIINEAMAEKFWPGKSPLGQNLKRATAKT
jgi:hypothetical protein